MDNQTIEALRHKLYEQRITWDYFQLNPWGAISLLDHTLYARIGIHMGQPAAAIITTSKHFVVVKPMKSYLQWVDKFGAPTAEGIVLPYSSIIFSSIKYHIYSPRVYELAVKEGDLHCD